MARVAMVVSPAAPFVSGGLRSPRRCRGADDLSGAAVWECGHLGNLTLSLTAARNHCQGVAP